MNTHDCTAAIEVSRPLERTDALNLFIIHQLRGHLPYLVEQEDGTYIVHRGERMETA